MIWSRKRRECPIQPTLRNGYLPGKAPHPADVAQALPA